MERDMQVSESALTEDVGEPIGEFAQQAFSAAVAACTTDIARLAPMAVGVPEAQTVLEERFGYEPEAAALIAEQAGRYAVRQAAKPHK